MVTECTSLVYFTYHYKRFYLPCHDASLHQQYVQTTPEYRMQTGTGSKKAGLVVQLSKYRSALKQCNMGLMQPILSHLGLRQHISQWKSAMQGPLSGLKSHYKRPPSSCYVGFPVKTQLNKKKKVTFLRF